MNERKQHDFFFDLSRFQRLFSKSLAHRLGQLGVQPGYLAVLFRLWEKDGLTQKELGRGLGIEQATLSNTLKRMERDRLVTTSRDKRDRRHSVIVLTDHGSRLRGPTETALEDLEKTVHAGLTINDLRYFRRIMRQMTDKLLADQDEALMVLLDEIVE